MVVAMIVASIGVHLVLWPVGNQVLAIHWDSPPLPASGGIMEVSLLGPDESEPPSPDPAVPPDEERPVVRPDFVPDKRAPDDARWRSEFDSRVERETRAPNRRRAEAYDSAKVGPKAGVGANAPKGSAEQDVPPHALPLGRLESGTTPEVGHPVDPSIPSDDAGRRPDRNGASAPRPGLRGTADAMRKTFGGGSGSFDQLPDVEDGTENLLNTDRFRFASFFNRMRDQIAQHWDPNGAMDRVDPDRRIYGQRTRKTLLHFRLTPKGAIKKIDILRDSGVRELDKEAIRSVHLAAPFVNPPPEMVDAQTGFIEVDFLFILDNDGRITRIRRYLR